MHKKFISTIGSNYLLIMGVFDFQLSKLPAINTCCAVPSHLNTVGNFFNDMSAGEAMVLERGRINDSPSDPRRKPYQYNNLISY